MTLDQAKAGQRVTILGVDAPEVSAQIVRFGLGVGEAAICQAVLPKGPVVLRKNRQEIAIGRELARAIRVSVA